MSIITILLTVSALGSVLFGTYLVFSSAGAGRLHPRWLQGGLVFNILLFAGGLAGLSVFRRSEFCDVQRAVGGERQCGRLVQGG